ncbi:hypothetical protein SMAC4_08626 [Sordaria macrospora]|uniref:uncharacterized protein n=1 Tax=Sordaria macrospora TaxID=5147 RepID=UPI002B2EC9A5|nr:hypothetical protein SMAC4_08626 [Sordaria macrospora]
MTISEQDAAARLAVRKPIPKPVPAYLPTAGSPLSVDKDLYSTIQQAPRVLIEEFTIPIRSGRAWTAPAGSIIRISTPEGPQVGDLNIWNLHNPRERFWASRTKQLYASHVSTYDRLWSNLPFMRPMMTIIADTLSCDGEFDFHCHSNLTRAVMEYGLNEGDVHDVINLFQVTGWDEKGRYFMSPCPATEGDFVEFLAEQDVLMALSTCPGGNLSLWGFGSDNEKEMIKCCRPLKVEVFRFEDKELLDRSGWKPADVTRAVFWAWNSSSIPLINYFGLEGLVGPFNL